MSLSDTIGDHEPHQPFTRVVIANRGEPAMRLINAIREWNAEGRRPLRAIALFTAVDRDALFVRESDEAVLIGPDDPDRIGSSPYLDLQELETGLRTARAEAVWPGWGFLSENADFARLCRRLGVVWVGPGPESMELLGDKIEAKRLAEQVGVPLAAWSGGPVEDLAAARAAANVVGYPLMVKATAGGGGRGLRRADSPADLDSAFERARSEASRTTGDATVFLEQALDGGRHVEVQVVADAAGDVWTLGVRDCSVQRRHQKVIEESASTALDDEQEDLLRRAAMDLTKAAGYVNAGTVEFLYTPHERAFSFLEVNTRLQVEHPVTEMVTGIDIVKLQLHVAGGGRLTDFAHAAPTPRGHAVEARLTAEDPGAGFAPCPGRIEHMVLPGGPGVRVDTGVAAGDVIPPQFDSMIAKVVAWGRDRPEARARLARALRQTSVVIDGGATNKAFLLDLLGRPEVISGDLDTRWLDGLTAEGYRPPDHADVALLAAAVQSHDAHVGEQRDRLLDSAARGRPGIPADTAHHVDVRLGEQSYRLGVAQTRERRYRVSLDDVTVDVDVRRSGPFGRVLRVGEAEFEVMVSAKGPDHLVDVDGAVYRVRGSDAGRIQAAAPAVVVSLPVAPGAVVDAGEVVAVVESMKMETVLTAPFIGRVTEVHVTANTQVAAGADLLRLERLTSDSGAVSPTAVDRVDLTVLASGPVPVPVETPAQVAAEALVTLRAQVLGFDVDGPDALRASRRLTGDHGGSATDEAFLLDAEIELLGACATLSALSCNRRSATGTERPGNHQEHFHTYLRFRDPEAAALPGPFLEVLRRALALYGVTSTAGPSAEVDAALHRISMAHRRAGSHVCGLTELLRRRVDRPGSLPASVHAGYTRVLDDLVAATRHQQPALAALARRVRYACVTRPILTAGRHERLATLDKVGGDPAGRAEAIAATDTPVPDGLSRSGEAAILEATTRRLYRGRPLGRIELGGVGHGRPVLSAPFDRAGKDATVVACAVRTPLRPGADLDRIVAGRRGEGPVVVDLYATTHAVTPGSDREQDARRAASMIGSFPPGVERIAVGFGGAERTFWLTFLPGPAGEPVEDHGLRGLHPEDAERLGLARLAAFDLTRLPSFDDVHLFRATSRAVADDRRLVVLAEVSGPRPSSGTGTASLTELEQGLEACLHALRDRRAGDAADARLGWNRVLLRIDAPLDTTLHEFADATRRIAMASDVAGLGIEQILVRVCVPRPDRGPSREAVLRVRCAPGAVTVTVGAPPTLPMRPIDAYGTKVLAAHRRGAAYPYELVPLLLRGPETGGPEGTFQEWDLDASGVLRRTDRAPGGNRTNIVVGTVTTPTRRYPEGMTRVVLLGDPTRAMGALAEPECRVVMAAIDLAETMQAPVEWIAVSSGVRIAMDSGTESMDWISRVLRSIIRFTQAGGEINVIVAGTNVGAQPYWNAEATMMMHTRGILVMTPDSTMMLTGKRSLDYSGGVSAEDNLGLGGYDRIMGPNGQAQYWAPDLPGAVDILLSHYAHTYRAPGERFPRIAPTADPFDRDISTSPHTEPDCGFTTVGGVFSDNPERKKPFGIRSILAAVADTDHPTLERWADMLNAESTVVLDAHLGGRPVALLGVESRQLRRRSATPADGPSAFTAGTLFPHSSKKMARAINAASGNRPVVVLANLSGFDGSPESLRLGQLEYGAEIGRAVVNFDGPIVFCVVSRYHGGTFVVFSGALNDSMEVAAVEGSFASVIGGAPAAAVVFAREVERRTAADPRIAGHRGRELGSNSGDEGAVDRPNAPRTEVHLEKQGEVAAEFEAVHTIDRARAVGSVSRVVPVDQVRPYLIDAIRRGMTRTIHVNPDTRG